MNSVTPISVRPFGIQARWSLWGLIALIVAGYIIESRDPAGLVARFGLAAPGIASTWQVLTYALLHGGLLHIGINLFMLWMFGRGIEAAWGGAALWGIFWVGAVLGALTHFALMAAGWALPHVVIGASGGIAALLGAFAVRFPRARVLWLFPPIPITVGWAILVLAVVQLLCLVTGAWSSVAHGVHLGGLLTGTAVAFVLRYKGDS